MSEKEDRTLALDQFAEWYEERENAKEAAEKAAADGDRIDTLQAQIDGLLDEIEKSGPAKDAGFVSPDSEGEERAEDKSFGDFLVAVRLGNRSRLDKVYKATPEALLDSGDIGKAAMAEGVGSTGGYLVPPEFGGVIEKGANNFSVLRQAGAMVQPMSGQTRDVPVLDMETAPSAGNTAYAGGAIAYWIEEAGSITESEPVFRNIQLVAHKLAGFALASNEVRQDAAESVDGLLSRSFQKAIGSTENYAFFQGDGVGKPLGILTGSGKIAITRSAASTVALADLSQMMSDFTPDSWATGAWFINPEVADQLIQLVSNPLSFLESLRSSIPTQLLGLPVYWTGALPALNTAGDILLADPEYYLIGDRAGVAVAYSEHFKFQNDQGAWRVTKRVDGEPIVNGVITLENGSTEVAPFVVAAAG